MIEKRKMYSVAECAELLGVSEPLVRKLVRQQKLASFRFGTLIKIDEKDVLSFMSQSYKGVAEECIS